MESPGFRKTHPLALGAASVMGVSLVGAALASSGIEKNVNKHYRCRVTTVRRDDGSVRTISQSVAPAVAVRDRVRIANGALIAHS